MSETFSFNNFIYEYGNNSDSRYFLSFVVTCYLYLKKIFVPCCLNIPYKYLKSKLLPF